MNLNNVKYRKNEIKSILKSLKLKETNFEDLPDDFKNEKINDMLSNIPNEPKEPDQTECCGSGCRPCVFDLYEEKLNEYEDFINNIYEDINKI